MSGDLRRWGLLGELVLLAGCGRLDNPDLQAGRVSGRLSGAASGAYAYVYGVPDRFTFVGADGAFQIDGVPAGAQQIVLFDGQAGAKMVPAQVKGAEVEELQESSPLPQAGRIRAAAVPSGGCTAGNPRFDVMGTIITSQGVSGSAVELYPLPVGTYRVHVSIAGFAETETELWASTEEREPDEIDLEVSGQSPGCVTNGCATPGLFCDPGDGWCYPCVTSAECGPGGQCTGHACSYASGGAICDACTQASQCGQNVCMSGSSGEERCSATCNSPSDCPAGFDCVSQGGAKVCASVAGCSPLRQTFGSPCFSNGTCGQAIKSGVCYRPGSTDVPGFCTAACSATQICPPGFTCSSSPSLCVPAS